MDRIQYLLAQPHQVCFELRQHGEGSEIPGERLVAVEQGLGMLFNNNVDLVEQALQMAVLDKGRPKIRHDEISNEHNALIREVDEHGVVSFSSLDRDELDACSPDLQLGAMVDCDIWLEAADFVDAEAFAEEAFIEDHPRVESAS